jgi:hypothetical protein
MSYFAMSEGLKFDSLLCQFEWAKLASSKKKSNSSSGGGDVGLLVTSLWSLKFSHDGKTTKR